VKVIGVSLLVFIAMVAFSLAAIRLADEPFWVEPTWRDLSLIHISEPTRPY